MHYNFEWPSYDNLVRFWTTFILLNLKVKPSLHSFKGLSVWGFLVYERLYLSKIIVFEHKYCRNFYSLLWDIVWKMKIKYRKFCEGDKARTLIDWPFSLIKIYALHFPTNCIQFVFSKPVGILKCRFEKKKDLIRPRPWLTKG